jgi:hypothetical protein
MCMFSKPVESVSRTQMLYAVFTHPQFSNQRVALQTYSNRVTLPAGQSHTTMILPVPVNSMTQVRLCNSAEQNKAAEMLFEHFHLKFEAEAMPTGFGNFGGFGLSASSTLPVVVSGSYLVSIADSLASLQQLDPDLFAVDNQALQSMLSGEASKRKYVYLACKLQENAAYHPFSYMYELNADEEVAFIPTMHYHPPGKATAPQADVFGRMPGAFGRAEALPKYDALGFSSAQLAAQMTGITRSSFWESSGFLR